MTSLLAPSASQQAVRAHQSLLNQIGVVPAKVQAFIEEIEHSGGAAKICGAGAVGWDAAGMVIDLDR